MPGFNIERVRYQKDLDAELRACNDIIMKLQQQTQFDQMPLSGKLNTMVDTATSPAPVVPMTLPTVAISTVEGRRKRT